MLGLMNDLKEFCCLYAVYFKIISICIFYSIQLCHSLSEKGQENVTFKGKKIKIKNGDGNFFHIQRFTLTLFKACVGGYF